MAHIQLIGVSEIASLDHKVWKFPYAIPMLISGIINTSHTFDVVDTHIDKLSFVDLIEYLKDSTSDIYGISAWSHNYLVVKTLIKEIRSNNKKATIIVGGILAGNYQALFENTDVDIVVMSAEGENIISDLLDSIDNAKNDLDKILGIAYRDRVNQSIVITPKSIPTTKKEYQKITTVPKPVYKYFDKAISEMVSNINSRVDVPVKGFPLLTQRGCPFKCSFCGFFTGSKLLRKTWEGFFNEVEYLIDRYGIQGIYSYDSNMFLNESDVDNYCLEYSKRGHSFLSAVELRPTFGSIKMFKKLYDHGVRVILFGIEHGSQEMLDRMNKQYDIDVTTRIFQYAVEAGLFIHGNLLFGTPGESSKTIRESRSLMLHLDSIINIQNQSLSAVGERGYSGYGWSVLVPAPPSALYEKAITEGYIKNEDDFLESLSDESNFKLLKGSNFAISLKEKGGSVNMSNFSTNASLIANIRYNKAVVTLISDIKNKHRRYMIDNDGKYIEKKESVLIASRIFIVNLLSVFSKYLKYILLEYVWVFKKPMKNAPFGVTQDSDWVKQHSARYDFPMPWSDVYSKKHEGRGKVVIKDSFGGGA